MDTLKIGWCNIEDGDGAKALADLLMFNQTLATVDMRGNKLVRVPAVPIVATNSCGCGYRNSGACQGIGWY